jgi:hypothetical protein
VALLIKLNDNLHFAYLSRNAFQMVIYDKSDSKEKEKGAGEK